MYSTPSQPFARAELIAGSAGLALAMGVGRFAFTPLFPIMQEHGGMTLVGGTWLASSNYLGYLIGALTAMSLRIDGGVAIRAALIATSLSTLVMGLTSSFTAWLALRGIAGIASAFLLVHISAWSLRAAGTHRLHHAGVFSGVGAGIFLVGSACIGFTEAGTNADWAWILLGLASFVVTASVWRIFRPRSAVGLQESCADRMQARAWRFAATYAAAGFGYIIPATFLPVIAKAHSAPAAALGSAWPALGAAAFGSTFIAAKLSRGSSVETWRWAQIVMALGVALPGIFPTLAAVIVSGVAVGGTFMVVTMTAMQASREFGGSQSRRLMAIMTVAFASGQIMGPLVAPLLLGPDADFSRLLWLSAAVLAAGVAVLPRRKARASIALAPKEI